MIPIDQMSLLFEVVTKPGTPNWKGGKSSSKPPLLGSILSIFRGVIEVVKYQDVQKTAKKKNGEPCNSKVFLKLPTCKAWRFQANGFLGVLWGRCQGLGQWSSWDFSWLRYNQQEKINWKNMLQIENSKHINTVRRRHSFFCGKIKKINNLCLLLFRLKPEGTYFSQSKKKTNKITTTKTHRQRMTRSYAPGVPWQLHLSITRLASEEKGA